ncbi:hypothetical protein NHP21005_19950 (plasmid) [Helicobacter sp. NHP21005]|uniref:hypothetical protein n=1 Tax=Helicobacter felistomachi TaxID=3040201 RepID=UPI002573A914|nr:hypothetical protein [Helicobacter sp. NHP21005]BEG58307.1 hypothetical protein NHP21005_19950 [Helicobacter sp. NHP21005]
MRKKLSPEQEQEILQRIRTGEKEVPLARKYDVSQSTISNTKNRAESAETKRKYEACKQINQDYKNIITDYKNIITEKDEIIAKRETAFEQMKKANDDLSKANNDLNIAIQLRKQAAKEVDRAFENNTDTPSEPAQDNSNTNSKPKGNPNCSDPS